MSDHTALDRLTYQRTTDRDGQPYCANCGCVEAIHDWYSLRCPRDNDPRWSVQD
jgi:hypothetical protein